MTARVLHLTLSFSRGGRRNAIANLATALASQGQASDLGCLEIRGCLEEEVPSHFERALVLVRRGAIDLRALHELSGFCRDRGIDLIHAHDAASLLTGALVQAVRPAPRLIYTFHRTAALDTRGFAQRVRNSVALSAARAVVVGSTDRRSFFLRSHWGSLQKVVRIPFGVDLARFRPDPESRQRLRSQWCVADDELVLGCIGHFWPDKGVDVVLRMYRLLGDAAVGAVPPLVILGEGSEERRRELEALAQACTRGRVVFAGFRQDVASCLAGFDVLVHAPRAEAFGLVLAEAAAVGLPVVATAVGGVTDIVREGRTGLLARSEDAAGLAQAVSRLLSDAALRRRLAAQGREVAAAEYSLELLGKRHVALYADVRAGRPPRGVD